MKSLADPNNALAAGLAAIRTEFQVPDSLTLEVVLGAVEKLRREVLESWETLP